MNPPDVDRVARFCDLLGLEHPVVQGGMTSVGVAGLAAAVSAAGGLGLVSAGRMTPAQLGEQIDRAIALAGRPVGVNLPISRDEAAMHALLAVAVSRDVALVVLGGGNPVPWAEGVLAAGRRLAIVTSTARQARSARALGACAVIVAGYEAGGRAGAEGVGGLVLVPEIVDAVDLPVVATGGIVDGRGAAAAICLGASAVQLGTRFMLSEESPLHPSTKAAMVAAGVADTLIVARERGLGRRLLTTPAALRVHAREHDATQVDLLSMLSGTHSVRGLLEGDVTDGLVSCGQGVGRIGEVLPAGEIVRRIAADMRAVLASASRAMDRAVDRPAA